MGAMPDILTVRTTDAGRRGFSLIEALVASVILAIVVLAVGSAVATGRQLSIEGQKTILAAMAADDLMGELVTVAYDDLDSHDGMDQPEGAMETLDGELYPERFWMIGRNADIVEEIVDIEGMGVKVRGKTITVTAYDEHRVLAVLQTFVPEPAS